MATRSVVFEVDGAQATSGVDFPIFAIDGTTASIPFYQFSATVDQGVQFTIPKVQDYASSPSAVILWNAASVNAGNVVWDCRFAAQSPADTSGLSSLDFDTSNAAIAAHSGGEASRYMSNTISLSATDGLADGDYLVVSIRRLGTDSSDTMADFAQLLGLSIEYSDT